MLSQVIQPTIDALHYFSTIMPLPAFTFIGVIVEEVLAPIPSPLVMTLAGSLAASSGQAVVYLVWLAFVGAVGKTLGSYVIYVIADKGEDFVLRKFGKFFGVSHKEIEAIGKHLNHGWRDDIVLFLLRAIPIIPTAPVSLVAGLIRVNLRTYLTSTFFGTLVRNIIYLYFGYTSLGALESLNEGLDSFESVGYVILAVLMAAGIGYMYLQRKKGHGLKLFDRLGAKKETK